MVRVTSGREPAETLTWSVSVSGPLVSVTVQECEDDDRKIVETNVLRRKEALMLASALIEAAARLD